MKKTFLFVALVFFTLSLTSCDNDNVDKTKDVEVTIHPETVFETGFMTDIWSDFLVYSDNNKSGKNVMNQIIFEGLDIDYQRGYEYKLKAKKIWMSNPPMDVSSVKYEVENLTSKKKVITERREEIIEITVMPEFVKYLQRYPSIYNEDESPKLIDAMLASQSDKNGYLVITSIDGFEYEEGYEYLLEVKKVTEPEPYSLKYQLVQVKDKKVVQAK